MSAVAQAVIRVLLVLILFQLNEGSKTHQLIYTSIEGKNATTKDGKSGINATSGPDKKSSGKLQVQPDTKKSNQIANESWTLISVLFKHGRW